MKRKYALVPSIPSEMEPAGAVGITHVAQLSLAVTVYVKATSHNPAVGYNVVLAGNTSTGGTVSCTITRWSLVYVALQPGVESFAW